MKTMIPIFLSAALFAQQSVPDDRSTDRTHKSTYERAIFSKKDAAGKVVPCGVLMELKNGLWRDHLLLEGTTGPMLDTRADAVTWMKAYCPIENAK